MSRLPSGSRVHRPDLRSGGRTLMRTIVVGALLAMAHPLIAQDQPTHPTFPPHFAITDARIVPVSSQTIENGTIVVRDGVITAVGPRAEVPADAWEIGRASCRERGEIWGVGGASEKKR